jgi:quinoprotein glucose dehydrogenase
MEFRTGGANPNNRSQIQCNPLVVDGVLYGTTPDLQLFALDAATGRELWRYNPAAGAAGGPAGVSRGLAFWRERKEQRILFGAGRRLHAIDPQTGKPIESFGDKGRIDLLHDLSDEGAALEERYLAITTPGALYRDLIIMGMRVGEGPAPSVPGHIRAYDVRTGARRWIFHTIPHPGEFGHDTWPADAWKRSGGANCWAGLVVDHERGLAFVPTGSAAFDFYGADRVGSNLFANCLIALDAATGQRRWHFQFVHHDLWDRDPPAAPVLCEVMRNGRKIAAVAQVTKTGHVWVFDRETGESLFPWHEEPVPASTLDGEVASPTQPVPLAPAPFARQKFTAEDATDRTPAAREAVLRRLSEVTPHRAWDPPNERGTIIFPGFDGGAEWGGPAVTPDGILYVNGNEMPWVLQMVPTKNFTGDPNGAQALYTQLCMSCHGPNLEGNAAANIPRLDDIRTRLKAADIGAILRTGKGVMPSFNFIPDPAKESLTAFLLSTAPTAAVSRTVEHAGVKESTAGAVSPYVTTGYNRFLDPDGYPAIRPPWGTLNALDLNTGEYLWRFDPAR